MKITAITYGDDNYKLSKRLNLFTAKAFGKADRTISYSRADIDENFINQNKKIFACKRGGGYWIWKPYIILKALNEIKVGEYLFYLDSGAFYIRRISTLIECMKKNNDDILLSSSILPNRDWCKKSLFKKMNCEGAKDIHQIEGGYILLKKTDKTVAFIKEWLELLCDFSNISDVPKDDLKYEESYFKEHRHDQPVLTNLAYIHKIVPYRGLSDRSEYKCYVNYKDGEFFGYSRKELYMYSREELESESYKKSDYKRMIINTRINTNNIMIFGLKLIKKILVTIYTDTISESKARKVLKNPDMYF